MWGLCLYSPGTDWICTIAAAASAAIARCGVICPCQDSTLRKFTGSLTNGLTVLAAIFLITAVFIVLYAMEWKKVSADVLWHNAIDALIHSGNLHDLTSCYLSRYAGAAVFPHMRHLCAAGAVGLFRIVSSTAVSCGACERC